VVQVGYILVNGTIIGSIQQESDGRQSDAFVPSLDGYLPRGRADARPSGLGEEGAPSVRHPHSGAPSGRSHGHSGMPSAQSSGKPSGKSYAPSQGGSPFTQGSSETDKAIQDASRAHDLDPNTMRAIASIESSMNPSSNANRSTQYKGLYQIGRNEWQRFGQGNIYSAQDNAMGAARMFDANRAQFKQRFGRNPTDTELYMMHQQGLGFYTRGAMTNIGGNPYPGMHGAQTHESFEAGWGREVARRKGHFEAVHAPQPAAASVTTSVPDPMTEPM